MGAWQCLVNTGKALIWSEWVWVMSTSVISPNAMPSWDRALRMYLVLVPPSMSRVRPPPWNTEQFPEEELARL